MFNFGRLTNRWIHMEWMVGYLFWKRCSQWDTPEAFPLSFFNYTQIYVLDNVLYIVTQTLSIRAYSGCILRSSVGNETFRVSPAHTYQPWSCRAKLIQEQCFYFPWEQIGFPVLCFIIKIVISDFCHFVLLPLTQASLGDCFQGMREEKKNYAWNWNQNTSPHYAGGICFGFPETT